MKTIITLATLILAIACQGQKTKQMQEQKHTNALIHETSPYLLQHAHNPVDWKPWGKAALEEAKAANKLMLISIGYSACHWCHVMEHESFENEEVAQLMNAHFICVKIDREEHPDVDQLYMNAVQLINGQGGWPLNVITLPDGRPFWGGTYFPKENWMSALGQIADLYQKDPKKVLEYAQNLTEGIKQVSLFTAQQADYSELNQELKDGVRNWKGHFDTTYGGNNRAPKFMMPNNWQFLLHYASVFHDETVLKHVELTLDKMAQGGVYDQAGGGFARYSVDALWKVPHFEKMLYDNAQLLTLYSNAYQQFGKEDYKRLVAQTIRFIKREMTNNESLFYSALDADSEGEEGKYYVWKKEQLQSIIKEDFELFAAYYNINKSGYWEHDNYILLRNMDDKQFAEKHHLSLTKLHGIVDNWNSLILAERSKRIRPGLDDKTLTAWNAQMCVGLLDAYAVFGDKSYLAMATSNLQTLLKKQMGKDGALRHSYKNGISKIDGFLTDYAFVLQALIKLTELSGKQIYYDQALLIMQYLEKNFWSETDQLYTFNNQGNEVFISHQFETYDNVIPAANSVMAHNLFRLGHLSGRLDWLKRSKAMLLKNMGQFSEQTSGLSNWGALAILTTQAFKEIVVVGNNIESIRKSSAQHYQAQHMLCFVEEKSNIPLFNDRYTPQTKVYVCENNTCKLPVNTWDEAWKQIRD